MNRRFERWMDALRHRLFFPLTAMEAIAILHIIGALIFGVLYFMGVI